MKQLLVVCIFLFGMFGLGPDIAFAQATPIGGDALNSFEGQLVPVMCNSPQTCGTCEFVELINNIIRFIITFATIAATLLIMYSGFRLVISGGNVAAKKSAKDTLTNVIVGYIILLAAFLIVNTFLGVLLPGNSGVLGWQQIECLYPTTPVAQSYREYEIVPRDIDALIARGEYTALASGGGSCSVRTDGACAASNMTCFANAADASRVCNLESSGGNVQAVSGSDLCADGRSFSGGLWQVNILAHCGRIPGCACDFFETTGGSAQGECLQYQTNSRGVRYCQYRNCRITDGARYNQCMNAVLNQNTNTQIACDLYAEAGGWQPWVTSARACNVMGGL